MAQARADFYKDGTWTAPAGVYAVTLVTKKNTRCLPTRIMSETNNSMNFFLDSFGRAWAIGLNTNGQLGVNDVTPRSSPTLVVGGLQFQQLSATGNAGSSIPWAGGVTNIGDIYMWGLNTNGQLGVGDTTPRSSPTIVAGSQKFQNLMAIRGGSSVAAMTPAGTLYTWGLNTNGELGVGDTTPRSSPTIVAGSQKFNQVVSSQNTTGQTCVVGLNQSGAAYAWGYNAHGELGVNDTTPRSSPTLVVGGQTFVQVASDPAGAFYGLTAAGAVYSWGRNDNGQLGDGTVTNRSSPVLVIGGYVFRKLFSGPYGSMLGLTTSNDLYAWGFNTHGQLGVGDFVPRSSPTLVIGGHKWSDISAGDYSGGVPNSFGITTDGVAYGWGENNNGELGINSSAVNWPDPQPVAGGLTMAKVLSWGSFTTFVDVQGNVYGAGQNSSGVLGDGTTTNRSSPVLVLGGALADARPTTAMIRVPVSPGTTYTVSMQQYLASFGGLPVAQGQIDLLSVFFDQ